MVAGRRGQRHCDTGTEGPMNATGRLLRREALQPIEHFLARHTRYVPAPVEAALFLTRRCNSRCSMCGNWHTAAAGDELTTTETIDILDQLASLGTAVVSLSAEGEISLRQDLPRLLEETARRGFLFSINSNLLHLSDEVVNTIARTRPYQVTAGIDTLDPLRYREIRGISDGVDRVKENIRKLRASGFPGVALGAVVLERNLDDLVRLAEFARANHLAGVRFTAFQETGFGKAWPEQELRWFRDPEYLDSLRATVERLIDMKRHGYPILNSTAYLRMIPRSYCEAGFFPVTCRAPWRRIQVFSDGDVSLCQVMEERAEIGSVRDTALSALWRSTRAGEVRQCVKEQGCGGCWLSCYAETNLRLSTDTAAMVAGDAVRKYLRLRR